MSEVISSNIGLDSLPIELIYAITDCFNPTDYSHDYQNAPNIIRLSRVNRSMNEILWRDPAFYRHLWRKYLSINIPNVPLIELRKKYYQISQKLETFEEDYDRLTLSVKEDLTKVFDRYFAPTTLVEILVIWGVEDEFEEWRNQKLHELLDLSIKHESIYIMERLISVGAKSVN